MNRQAVDPGSLDRLHDIVVPPPVPWWPPAPAWYVVLVVAVVTIGLVTWAVASWWLRGQYRRAALRELARLQDSPADPPTVAAVAALVKRVALAAYPRERVASLSGGEWLAFLDTSGGDGAFTTGPGRMLEAGYEPGARRGGPELIAVVRRWIRRQPGAYRC